MIIRWYGHTCFLFYSKKGTRILIDPYGESLPYEFPPLSCEVVVVSHEHPDHNAVWRVAGEPRVVKRTSDFPCEHELPIRETGEVYQFKGIPSFHDEVSGKKRGPNTIYLWTMDQVKLCHLGDLGHVLNEKQKEAIGKVDVLFVPVGGGSGQITTIGPKEATIVVDQLRPSLVIPMHYKTPYTPWKMESVESFTALMGYVEQLPSNSYEVKHLPSAMKVVVFKYP